MTIAANASVDLCDVVSGQRLDPVHPGEVLALEFLKPIGMSGAELASVIGVPRNRVSMILNGERSITSDTALRLSRAFGTSAGFWMSLQTVHDLERAEIDRGDRIRAEIQPVDLDARLA